MKTQLLRHLIILLTLITCLMGFGNMAQAHVYWSPDGDDRNDGSSEAKAVKTWARAKALIISNNTLDHWIVVCGTISNVGTMDGTLTSTKNAKVIRKIGWGGRMFSGTLTTSNVTIDGRGLNGSYASDAVEMIASGTTVTINSGTVIQNNRSTNFGSIWMTNGGVFVMNGGTIQDCSAKEGGALFSGANNTFTIHGGTIKNCHASSFGGAICLRSGSYTLTIDGGTIDNCYSPKGGAVYVAPNVSSSGVDATITFSGGTIKNCNNAAIVSGAAFYVGSNGSGRSITLNLSGGTIDNCDTSGTGNGDGGGGVFCNQGELTLNMSGTTIKNCDAVRGGGIHVYGITAYITLSGGVIDNCSGSTYGGGAYVNGLTSGSWFKMDNTTAGTTGCEIKNCSSKGHAGGGGLFLYGSNFTATLTKGLVHNCTNADPDNSGAGRGGGVLLDHGITAYINGDNMKIYDNDAGRYGGGVQLANSSTLYFSKGEIYGNEAGDGAAGIHVTGSATLEMSGGKLYGNETPGVGGGIHSSEGCTLNITGGQIYNNIAHTQGGGININTRCNLEIPDGSTLEMYGNKACRGGAIMVDGALLTIRAGSYHDNQALDSYTPSGTNVQVDTYGTGGAFCLVTANNSNTFASECSLYSGTLNNNSASKHGGAIYIGKTTSVHEDPTQQPGSPEMHILGAATISNNKALDGNGGGIFLETGTFEMTDGTITGNSATEYGGGFYVTTVSGKTLQADISGGSIVSNSAVYGGGFAVVGGTCNIKGTGVSIGASGTPNRATYGAGLYAHGGTTTITKGNIQYNEATQDGGGIYADGGLATVNYAATSDGKIHHNYAGKRGGGLFISTAGRLDLKGKTTLEYNRVPEGELGGGVYLEGTVQAGASSSDIIVVKDNYADNTEGATITATNRNNIYLPDPVDTQTKDVITVVNNGLNLGSSKIGFSVPHNFVPVIYCATAGYLSPTIMNSDAIFEDSERYTKYYSTTSPYKANYIYLSADTWYAAVATQPAGFSFDNIDSPEDLAWLISLVNGRTTPSAVTASTLSGTTVTLTADIDMKAHSWVPIGFTGKSFNGTFNGNGHTISNVYCSYLGEGQGGTGSGLGLFGTTDGATIHDVFLHGVELDVRNQTSGAYVMGAIANEAKGGTVIYNCTADATMESTWPSTTMGGLVGKLTNGTIHSSAAMPAMTGYTMGGVAGTVASGSSLYNSFSNPKFKYSGAANACFVGGLAAENAGIIQNCYVRFTRASSGLASAKFGQLAGSAGTGLVTVCYHPATYDASVPAALKSTGDVSSKQYGDVVAPYLYNHSNDNIVANAGDASLLEMLNGWVSGSYAPWKRTKAGGYSGGAGNINGDYPIHKHTAYTCAASTNNGVTLDYAATLDGMLARHQSNATVNLYGNDRTAGSTGSEVLVYIDENVSLLQSDATKQIAAYTCQTLKSYTRGERWHYFSSSLSNSGIGFNYGTTEQVPFSWAENPCDVTFSTTDDQALFPSDMPHINKVDLYCFYEPEYHWLNLKRNTASHWHMNAPTVPIVYIGNGTGGDGNETSLVPGKGYLVSIDREQLVQNGGTLNNGDVTLHNVTKTDFNAWAGLLGYNLLGNPYQSYLDIEKFMAENSTALWGGAKDEASVRTYAVYDPETDCYLQYKRGVSRGARATSGLLNPHQGFLIRKTTTDSGSNTQVKFTNAMRSNDGTPSFREPQPAYPLVNVVLTDSQGRHDLVVLELGRNADEGVEKLRVGECSGRIGLALGSESYAILFRDETAEQQALRFEAEEEGGFTLRWETANAEFESLTLVDNIDGTTTDMLSRDSYSFEGNPDQYASRFRIVIGEYKGIEEPEVPEPVEGPTCSFAYQTGDQLVVEGEGTLEVVDMLGRVVMTERFSDGQSRVRVPQTAGVYLLRLTGKNGTRTQKIVTK